MTLKAVTIKCQCRTKSDRFSNNVFEGTQTGFLKKQFLDNDLDARANKLVDTSENRVFGVGQDAFSFDHVSERTDSRNFFHRGNSNLLRVLFFESVTSPDQDFHTTPFLSLCPSRMSAVSAATPIFSAAVWPPSCVWLFFTFRTRRNCIFRMRSSA